MKAGNVSIKPLN